MNTTLSRQLRRGVAAATLASSLVLAGCGDSPESLIAKAKESIAKNEPKAAEIHLKNLLQKGDNAEARYLLGTVYLSAGDWVSAEKELRRALDGGFDASKSAPALAEALVKTGRFQDAIEAAGKASPATPEGKASLATLVGRAKLSLGDADGAQASFEAARAALPDYVPAEVGLLTLRASKGDLAGASSALDQLLAKSPGSAEALKLKGDLEVAQGRFAQGREFLAKAAQADPHDRTTRAKIVSIAIDQKDYEGAQKTLNELKKLTGPAPATMHLQALIHFSQNQFEPARDAVQAALRGSTDYLPAVALAAQVFLALDSAEQAERYARVMIDRQPSNPIGYRVLGAALVKMNQPQKALEALQPAIDRGVQDAKLYVIAADAAVRVKDLPRAIAWYEKAGKLDPASPLQKSGLGLALIAKGEKQRGIAELEAASAMPGGDARADQALIAAYVRDRQFDRALAVVDRIEKRQPGSAQAASLRGSVLLAKGDAPSARKAFELALQRDPKSLQAASNLASLDLRDNKPDAAKERYASVLERDPNNVGAMLALSQLILRTAPKDDAKARERALDLIRKARQADKTSVPAALALAGWHIGKGEPKEAIPLLQETLAAKPDNIELLDALGTAYLRAEQPAQAMEAFEKVLKLRPDSALIQLQMGRLKASLNDLDGAVVHLRRAVALLPNALEPRAALAQALFRQGKTAEARQVALALQKEYPNSGAGAAMEGDIAMAERRFGDAVAAYRRSLAVEKAPPVQLRLHQALVAAGSAAEADALMRTMMATHPDDPGLRSYAGELAIARKRWPEAIGHYQAVLAKQPQNAVALNNIAWAMHEAGDPKALEFAEKAYAAAPKSPAVLDTLGVILVARGDTARAVPLLKEAVAASPKAPGLRLHLAEALMKAGDKAGAKSELETVLRDAPDGPVADAARQLQKQL